MNLDLLYPPGNLAWGASLQFVGRGFWLRHALRLPELLEAAHQGYRTAMKGAHADKGGSHERAVLLNAAWSRVKRLFEQHGVTEN